MSSRKLALRTLARAGACADQREEFRRRFGAGVDITAPLCVSVADVFDWDWAARLLTDSERAEFERVTAPAWAKYMRATAAAWAKYMRATAAAWAKYDRARAAAWAKYDRARAAAWAECYIRGA